MKPTYEELEAELAALRAKSYRRSERIPDLTIGGTMCMMRIEKGKKWEEIPINRSVIFNAEQKDETTLGTIRKFAKAIGVKPSDVLLRHEQRLEQPTPPAEGQPK